MFHSNDAFYLAKMWLGDVFVSGMYNETWLESNIANTEWNACGCNVIERCCSPTSPIWVITYVSDNVFSTFSFLYSNFQSNRRGYPEKRQHPCFVRVLIVLNIFFIIAIALSIAVIYRFAALIQESKWFVLAVVMRSVFVIRIETLLQSGILDWDFQFVFDVLECNFLEFFLNRKFKVWMCYCLYIFLLFFIDSNAFREQTKVLYLIFLWTCVCTCMCLRFFVQWNNDSKLMDQKSYHFLFTCQQQTTMQFTHR